MKYQRNPWSRIIAYLLIIIICLGSSILRLPVVEVQAESTSDGLEYVVNDDQTVTITKYNGSATELQIPADIDGYPVTGIGYRAFKDCSSLTSIEIPDSVTSIGDEAFNGCTGLTAINVDSDNTVYMSVEGVLLNNESTTLITCPQGKSGTYSIPDSVTRIWMHAFENCISLTSIEIPNSVTSILDMAFYGCSSLTSIKIPNSVTYIGGHAFYGSSLTSIEIPNSITSIEGYTFYMCSSLTSIKIPNSVTSIGVGAFFGCSGLTSIEIPNSVTYIGGSAFNNCGSLTSVKIPDSVTSIGVSAFHGCSSLTSIEIPDSVTSLRDGAFYGCSNLTKIEIPKNVTYISDYLFNNCSSLTSIKIPDSVTSIEDNAFTNCSSLTSIEIPNSVTSIGDEAFSNCSSLTCIEIPNSVTNIGKYPCNVFLDCSSLISINVDSENTVYASVAGVLFNKKLTALYTCPGGKEGKYSIPDSVEYVGEHAFGGCSRLTSIEIPDSVTTIVYSAFYDCSSLTSIEIPNSVTYIGEYAFSRCNSLSSIEIPNSVTYIGEYAFFRCNSLTSIGIPDSIRSIGDSTFKGCSSLTSIEIPDSVSSIGNDAFDDTAVDHVIFSGSRDAWNILTADDGSDGNAILRTATVHYNAKENVIIPEAPILPDCVNNGYTAYKCSLCEKEYRSDFVPPTGHSFQDDICSKCGRSREDCIESAHPYGNNTDETYTIYRPRASEIKVTFSSATKLSDDWDQIIIYGKENYVIGWYYKDDLASKQIQVPGDTVKIQLVTDETGSSYGFAVSDIEVIMTDPTEPTPPDAFEVSVTSDQTASIDSYTGTETDIVIPEEINGYKTTSISDGAFKDSAVTSIVLPESVTKIGAGAFAGSDLKRITITANEVEIAEDAFEGCENVIICCYSASKAYAFAQAHGIAVELLDEKPAVVYGDLDGSGSIDANDALLILRIAAKLQTPTEEQRIAGDVDESNNVDANDALYVLKKAAKLIDVFPAEAK